MEAGKITIIVVDKTGHSTQELVYPALACQKLREYEGKGYWVTLNGQFTRAGEVSEADVQNAKDITLVTEIQGG
jgi:sulfur carrier protein ThiS